MNFSFVDPWQLFLPIEGGHVVSISGSGGKTSLLRTFATLLAEDAVPTILTCTTRTEGFDDFPVYDLNEITDRACAELPPVFSLRDGLTEDHKWQGLSAEAVDLLTEQFPRRVILVEVDGAGKKPLKYYRDGEPVWPRKTSLAVVNMGLGAVGSFAGDVVYRFDTQPFAPLAGLDGRVPWQWDHLFTLLTGEGGYLDQVPDEVPVVLALSCLGQQEDSIGLFEFVGRAMEVPALPLVLFYDTGGEYPSFRTACRQDDDNGPEDQE